MKRYTLVFAVMLGLVGSGWVGAEEPAEKKKVKTLPAAKEVRLSDTEMVVQGNTAFALELYAKLAGEGKGQGQPGNLFFSPYSISSALAMTYGGARGQTAKQMGKVLHYALQPKKLHPVLGQLQRQLNEKGKAGDFQLAVANALWRQQGYVLLPDYVQMTEKFYQAPLEELDFVQAAEEARLRINGWVEEKTQEKIKDLIQPGVLDAATRLVLTNAIYFKGDWRSQFKKEVTEKAPFYVTKEEQSEAEMMFQKGEFTYAEADGIQILELPYKGEQLSMLVLLPGKRDGLKDLENKLTVQNLQKWQKKAKQQEVEVYLPKFKMTSEFSLGKVLAEMGMGDAFSEQADFSGMNGNKELFLSAVVHKAFVEVNEEGTEAAAATGVVMTLKAMPMPPVVFRADHPFVFGIRDNEFGSILFLGRVVKPGD